MKVYVSCQIWKTFNAYSSNFCPWSTFSLFQHYPFSPLLPGVQWHKCFFFVVVVIVLIVSQFLQTIVILFSLFHLLFKFGKLYYSIFVFTDSFLCPLHYIIEYMQRGFYFGYCILSILNFIFDFLLYLFFPYWDFLFLCGNFLFCICLKYVNSCSFKHFYDGCFKIYAI